MKKILIIDSSTKRNYINDVVIALKQDIDFDYLKIKKTAEPAAFSAYLKLVLLTPFFLISNLTRLTSQRFKAKEIILVSLIDQLICTLPAKILGYKVYWYVNDFFAPNFTNNILSILYRLYSRLTLIICNSEAIKDYLQKHLKIKESRITIIKRGFDPVEMLKQETIYEDLAENKAEKITPPFVLGFIGDLKKENGVEYLIKAVDFLKDLIIDFQIIIIGDGPEKKNLHWLVKTLGYDQKIRFVGNQNNVKKWYRHFKLLIVPKTVPTNFSNVAAEAMSIGVPVIGFDIPGVTEVVNNQGGILVPQKSADGLAKAILELYNNKELRERFGQQAKSRINYIYSMDKMKENYKKIFA